MYILLLVIFHIFKNGRYYVEVTMTPYSQGGMFYYVGYKAKAKIMADERMAKARKDSGRYYYQPWV